jgi:chemotaxis protein MotB
MLDMEGIEPERLAAVGYGEHQPLARNDTEEGRRRNRRVVLLISREASIRGVMR